MKTDIIDLKL